MKSLTICVKQSSTSEKKEGKGDCSICTPDYKNVDCSDYIPRRVFIYEVKK